MPENDPISYLEAYFKKYWILSGQSVRQKKLSLPAMHLEYKNVSALEQRGAVWENRYKKKKKKKTQMSGKHN